MISTVEIQRSLKTEFVGHDIHYFEVVDSTNTAAKRLAETGVPEGTVVIAEYQTAGRGRFNRKWHGEPGKNIFLSIILRPHDPRAARVMTYIAAASAAEAVEEETRKHVECKWPNDLLIKGRKFCGILLESSWQESSVVYLILGIGMNVNEESFPSELGQTATSLTLECGHEIDRERLICRFLRHLETHYLQSRSEGYGGVLTAWKARCSMFGKEITVEQSGKKFTGTAVRLDTDGALVLKHDHREIRVFAGDVTVKG